MTKKCTQPVPMPSKPESRRKENGYIVRQHLKDMLDIASWLGTNIDQLVISESASQKQAPHISANKNLRELVEILHELEKTLNGGVK